MLEEVLEGEFLDMGVAGAFELGPLGGFLLRPDMIKHQMPLLPGLVVVASIANACEG